MADAKDTPKNDILANMSLLQGNKADKIIVDEITTEAEQPETTEQPETPAVATSTPTSDVSFFLRKGTTLTVPLRVPNLGEQMVTFENATVALRPAVATAMREELKRNARLAQVVFEADATNPDMQEIVAHHKAVEQHRRGGQSGVDSTINTSTATEFRDATLYASQPQGRHADVLLQGKQASIAP